MAKAKPITSSMATLATVSGEHVLPPQAVGEDHAVVAQAHELPAGRVGQPVVVQRQPHRPAQRVGSDHEHDDDRGSDQVPAEALLAAGPIR
jgi:hypothetical protein